MAGERPWYRHQAWAFGGPRVFLRFREALEAWDWDPPLLDVTGVAWSAEAQCTIPEEQEQLQDRSLPEL